MNYHAKTLTVLTGLVVVFLALAAAFLMNLWGRPVALPPIPLVDTNFLSTATTRQSYADLIKAGADLSDFDCYACHEKGKPPRLRFDTNLNLIVPKEHSDIVMHHGTHERNNNCFNCHDENNLEQFQTRDKRELKLSNSAPLCGSCHGPTYRDWEAGVHGRTSGYWDRELGPDRPETLCELPQSARAEIPRSSASPGAASTPRLAVAAGCRRKESLTCQLPIPPHIPFRRQLRPA